MPSRMHTSALRYPSSLTDPPSWPNLLTIGRTNAYCYSQFLYENRRVMPTIAFRALLRTSGTPTGTYAAGHPLSYPDGLLNLIVASLSPPNTTRVASVSSVVSHHH
jgi:hypothetical protein